MKNKIKRKRKASQELQLIMKFKTPASIPLFQNNNHSITGSWIRIFKPNPGFWILLLVFLNSSNFLSLFFFI